MSSASGGPNVVPADDPPMAQCIARAPGGPTHVLLDDRIAEHVPGCNMAFRREALLAIGGFNPDLPPRRRRCGRVLAAAGARLARSASPSSALVWHHHRASVKAYWRQQVGYGEGERWLMAHHPGEVPRRPHAVARPHLQSAAVRALAVGRAHQCRRLGHAPRFRRSTAPTSTRSHSCRTRSGGRCCRSCSRWPAPWSPGSAAHQLGGGDAARRRPGRHRRDACRRTSPTRSGPTSIR